METRPARAEDTAPRIGLRGRGARLLGSLAITALLLWAILSEQTPAELLTLARNIRLDLVLVYAALSMFGMFIRAARYGLALRQLIPGQPLPRFRALLIITAIRNALVDFLPARLGELSVLYVLNRYGVAVSTGALVFGLCLIFDMLALVVLSALALCASAALPPLGLEAFSGSPVMIVLLLSAAGAGLLLLLRFLGPITLRVSTLSARVSRPKSGGPAPLMLRLSRLLEKMAAELSHAASLSSTVPLLATSLLLRICKYGSLYLLFLAVVSQWGITAADISPVRTTLAFLAAEATASLPISGLMGFGAYEGAWSLVFSGTDLGVPSIPAVIFLVHLVSQALTYSIGLLAVGCVLAADLIGRKRAPEAVRR